MHPLGNDLSNLSDDEITKKLADLNKRYVQAYRIGPQQIIPQLQMLIQDYQDEMARRNAKLMQEMQEKMDKSGKKGGGSFKDIINIG
jgi:hypothetical protein